MSNNGDFPDSDWLLRTYGIVCDHGRTVLAGKMAKVCAINDVAMDRKLVLRVTDTRKFSLQRLERVHRFFNHQHCLGVSVVQPIPTVGGASCALYDESRIVEVYTFIEGRQPDRGDGLDIALVAHALAVFHNAGTSFTDLPDEDDLDQNHVGLKRFRETIRHTEGLAALAKGETLNDLLAQHLRGVEAVIGEIERLRPQLVQTALHLDTGPNNIIIDDDGTVWFIDCNHALVGRRTFDVACTLYYHDLSSVAQAGDSRKYVHVDSALTERFMTAYTKVCDPAWRDDEEYVVGLEYRLMLAAGMCYRVEYEPNSALVEMERFLPLCIDLAARYPLRS
jgi:Ser/Thr protein kinase RdoA (MazF antagonist)